MPATLDVGTLVRVPSDWLELEAELALPEGKARGLVLFAHGTGSTHHSPRNQLVSRALREAGLATFLLDLLGEEEQLEDLRSGNFRYDVPLLARRLVHGVRWLEADPRTAGLPLAFFGSSTGAAAALVASVTLGASVKTIVCRGARADLAGDALGKVAVPTLFIVGGRDLPVLRACEKALESMRCKKSLAVVPGATHLFEEPSALTQVTRLAETWLKENL